MSSNRRSRSRSHDRRRRSRSWDRRRSRSRSRDRRRRSPSHEKRRESNRGKRRNSRDEAASRKDLPRDKAANGPAPANAADKPTASAAPPPERAERKKEDTLTTRTGGAYIPPAKLRMLQAQITDKGSMEFQRLAWEALKKSINGLVNKVNVSNIDALARELLAENIVRGRGLLTRSLIQAQQASPTFTHVYAALVAIVNSKFPNIGDLLVQRLLIQFKRGFKRNDKTIIIAATRFMAHLVNQEVVHEIIALEVLMLLLENPTEDSVEVAVAFLKEVGEKLSEVAPRGLGAIIDRMRAVLHESSVDKRVQYMIEVMMAIKKDGFKDHKALLPELDIVPEGSRYIHMKTLEDPADAQPMLNVFKFDASYEDNEQKYSDLKREMLASSSSEGSSGSGESGGSDSESESDEEEEVANKQVIVDQTETNLVALRRTIYLTIQSSLDFEECAHKMLKLEIRPGQEAEVCNMILDCCGQQRTYEKFFGLLAQRFCMLKREYMEPFHSIFKEQYETIHRLDTNKLRNVAKFFAHLLYTDAVSWEVLECIRLNEEDTTSSGRIFIKFLFQDLSEYMGLSKLNIRLQDETLQPYFEGVLPRDNPKHTRFAINFFTTIGLGGLTDALRDHLKNVSRQIAEQKKREAEAAKSSESSSSSSDSSSGSGTSSSSSSSSSGSGSSSSDSSSSESSESEPVKDKRKKLTKRKPKPKSLSKREEGSVVPVVSRDKAAHRAARRATTPTDTRHGRDNQRQRRVNDVRQKRDNDMRLSEDVDKRHSRDNGERHGRDNDERHGRDNDKRHSRDNDERHGRDNDERHSRDNDERHSRDNDERHSRDNKAKRHRSGIDMQHSEDDDTRNSRDNKRQRRYADKHHSDDDDDVSKRQHRGDKRQNRDNDKHSDDDDMRDNKRQRRDDDTRSSGDNKRQRREDDKHQRCDDDKHYSGSKMRQSTDSDMRPPRDNKRQCRDNDKHHSDDDDDDDKRQYSGNDTLHSRDNDKRQSRGNDTRHSRDNDKRQSRGNDTRHSRDNDKRQSGGKDTRRSRGNEKHHSDDDDSRGSDDDDEDQLHSDDSGTRHSRDKIHKRLNRDTRDSGDRSPIRRSAERVKRRDKLRPR